MSAAALPQIERQQAPLNPVPSAILLGAPGPVGRRNLFYSQSMALLRVLLADATTRPAVVRALEAYMAGDDPGLHSGSAFGDGAEAWGQRALDAARAAAGR